MNRRLIIIIVHHLGAQFWIKLGQSTMDTEKTNAVHGMLLHISINATSMPIWPNCCKYNEFLGRFGRKNVFHQRIRYFLQPTYDFVIALICLCNAHRSEEHPKTKPDNWAGSMGLFNIYLNMPSYQYRDSHCKYTKVSRSLFL